MEELVVQRGLQHIVSIGAQAALERVRAHGADQRRERQQQRRKLAETPRGSAHRSASIPRRLAARRAGRYPRQPGVLLFCGSLYLLLAGAPHQVGVLTPLGGLALIAAWCLAAVALGSRAAASEQR